MTGHPQHTTYLADQRWFAGKGRAGVVSDVRTVARASDVLRIDLVEVSYPEGAPASEVYQLPVTTYAEPQDHLGHALVHAGDGTWTYDALHDRDALPALLAATLGDSDAEGLTGHRVGDHEVPDDARPTFFSGEQSNSSVIFGEDAVLKVFRKLHPGPNPDIELLQVLTEAGSTHVAALYGWASTGSGDEVLDLMMLQQFLRTASDGWELALASVRNLLVATDLDEHDTGGDFAAEAQRLGAAVAEVHEALADALGTGTVDSTSLADQMQARLDQAVAAVGELVPLARGVAARFDLVRGLAPVTVHRVHGDLHLGQTLRTSLGWKLVDFEGEPAKELAERLLPDSPWRDVAGMIRSFHYAGAAMARDLESSEYDEEQTHGRAAAWAAHATEAFLEGYAGSRGAPLTADERVLLDAYVADKAVYEAGYEARNRPGWLPIPLAALAELAELADPSDLGEVAR